MQVSPLNPATGLPVTLYLSCAGGTSADVVVNGNQYVPVITKGPTRSISYFGEAPPAVTTTQIDHGSIEFRLDSTLGNTNWANYSWDGATAQIWIADRGSPWSSYTLIYTGACGPIQRQGQIANVALLGPEQVLDTNILTAEYAGNGNAEGPGTLLGVVKPRCYGDCFNIEAVLIDPIYWVYQFHGYGAVQGVTGVYENAYPVNATSAGDFASYAALIAATLAPGQWATCLAQGMFRLGGQPNGKITADVQGAVVGGSYLNTVATIVPDILKVAGLTSAQINQTSFNTFTQNWRLYLTDQAKVGDVARSALQQVQGYLVSDSSGNFRCGNFFGTRSPVTLRTRDSTAIGGTLIRSIKQLPEPSMNWKVKVGYDRAWSVNSDSEISSALFDAATNSDAAQTAAQNAADAAAAAQADADNALAQLDNFANDGILTQAEKIQVVQRWNTYTAEKSSLDTQATSYSITTEKTSYDNAYSTLNTYLTTTISPSALDTTQNSNVTRSTWDSNWQTFETARMALYRKIADVTATRAQWSGVTGTGKPADGATVGADWNTNVTNKPTTLAQFDAASATQLTALSSDDYLDRSEKSGPLKNTIADVESRYQYVLSRATTLALSTSAMTTARSNFYALLNTYSPAYNDYTQDTTIYSHFFADKLFTTGWTVSIATTAANGAYTTLTDPSTSSWATVVRSKSQPLAATQYTIGMVVKKDSVPRTTRYPLMRLSFGGGTAKQCDWNLDTSTGDVGTTSSNNWDAAGVFDLGNDWLLWGTATSNTDNNIVQYAIYPCVGASSTLGSYNAAVTGSVDVMPPLIVQGNYTKLGHFMLTGLLKAYTDQIETLWKSISGQDATTANWPNITGTGKPADNATVNNPRGVWSGSSVAYAVNDMVSYANTLYICILAHTSTATTPPNDSTHWAKYTPGTLDDLSDGTTYGRPVISRLNNGKPWIDFAEPIHSNKNLDNIGDGTTYGRPIISRLNGGKPWIDFSEGIHSNKNLDNIGDGSSYARISTTRVNASRPIIDFSEAIHFNKNVDNIDDGATYARLPVANSYGTGASRSAKIDFSQPHVNKSLTYIGDDANYAKVSAGRVNAGRPTIDFSETIHANKNLANVDSAASSKLGGIAPNAGTPLTLKSIGSGSLAIVGNGGTKTTATSAWDTAARSNQSFRNSAYMTGRITAGPTMIGLTTDNSTVSYTGLTAAFYYDGSGWYLYSNGSQLGSISASSGNALSIEISDQIARFYVDGSNVYNLSIGADQRWFFGAALCNLNSAFADVTFGQSYGSYLSIPGSGVRVGDTRNLPAIAGSGARYKFTGAISWSSTPGSGSATISVGAGSSLIGSTSVSYSAMSVSVSGSVGSEYIGYLYVDDPSYQGGSRTLVSSTDGNQVYQNDGRVWIGSVDFVFPASGGSSGGGGTIGGGLGCVTYDSWVETRDRGFVRAQEIVAGDFLRCLNETDDGTVWVEVLSNHTQLEPSYRLTSASGITLRCSETTPLTLKGGEILSVPDLSGQELPIQDGDDFRWEPCSSEPIGLQPVSYISVGGHVYAAGDEQGRAILTHNTSKP